MVTTQNLESYYQDIKRRLRGSSSYRLYILENIENDIESFLADYPDATEQDILKRFGKPEDFIREYEVTMTHSQRIQDGNFRRNILVCVVAALLIGLLVWMCGVVCTTIEANKHTNGYSTREIMQRTYMEVEQ